VATSTDVVKVQVPESAPIEKEAAATADDLRTGEFVAVTARPESDGKLTALIVRIFPAALGSVRAGQFPMTGANQGNLMTNATITSWDRSTLVVDFSGEKATFAVPADAELIKSVPAQFGDLQVGWRVLAVPASRQPDGTIVARSVNALGNPVR